MVEAKSLRTAIFSADPRLSRFEPLERIEFYDDFDAGLSGWTELMGNYDDPDGSVFQLPEWRRDFRAPMLSNMTMPDIGTHGAMQGSYALKIATRPKPGHMAKSLKRITWVRRGVYQVECFFTYKPEPSSLKHGEDVFRAFGISFDLQDEEHRYHLAIRYLNATNGELHRKWQYMARGHMVPLGVGWDAEIFEDVPGGAQELCYNETVTKLNWHYLRWVVDLGRREHVELQSNDRTFDMRGTRPELRPIFANLPNLLNLGFWVEADTDVRCFFCVDSVLLSTERGKE